MLINVLNRIKGLKKQTDESLTDALGLIVQLEDREMLLDWLQWVRKEAMVLRTAESLEITRKTYFLAGQRGDLDSYCIALEWYRSPEKRFYLPRRAVLKPLVDDLQDLLDGKLDFLGVSLPPRVGKLVSDDTPVLTKNGWKNHGDLVVGDEVISPDGKFVSVTNVFPKDYANVRVHFTDGTHADVHENHEWKVYNRHKQSWCVMETKEMFVGYESGVPGKRGHRYHYLLPHTGVVEGVVKELPVPAYTFGAWLGDGVNTNPTICGDKGDRAIIERVVADGYPISWHTTHATTGVEYYGFRGLRQDLQKIGLCHSRRNTFPCQQLGFQRLSFHVF